MTWEGGTHFLTRVAPMPVYLRAAAYDLPPIPTPKPAVTEPPPPSRRAPRERRPKPCKGRAASPPKVFFSEVPDGWPALPSPDYRVGRFTGKVYWHNKLVVPCPKCGKVYVGERHGGCEPCALRDGTRIRAAAKRLGRL